VIAYFYLFHLATFATITISFAPHLAAMTSFLPLERVRPIDWVRRRRAVASPDGDLLPAPSLQAALPPEP
jgi:hypothetical protein